MLTLWLCTPNATTAPATFAPNAAPTSWLDRLAAAFVWAATGRTR